MKKPAKVSYYITLLLFVAFGIQAHAQRGLMVSTNGALFNYTNFFDVNVEKMVSALNSVGYGGDDGSFSAKTNQANVFGNYQQQFLGPVLVGNTNLLDKLNELSLGKLQQWDVLDAFGESLTWVAGTGDIYFWDGNQLQGMPFPRGLGTEWNIGIIGGQPQWVPNRYAYRDTNNAYAASQDFTGATITVPTQSDGTSNTTAASTAFVMRNRSSGAGSPYAALTNQPNAYSDLQTFAGGAAVGPTNLVTKLASLDSSKQNQDVDLDAVSALSGTGLIARTGSGTATNRSVAGDTEIVVTNGDGVAGNIVLSIGAAIARASALASYQALDADLTALAAGTAMPTAITNSVSISAPVVNAGSTNVASALAGKQPLNSNLTTLATLDGSALTNLNASELRSGTVAAARLGSGTANSSTFLRGDGSWSTPTGSGDVLAAGNNTLTGTNTFSGPNTHSGTETFNGTVALNGATTVSNLTVSGTLSADSASYGTPIGLASGGTGAGTAAGARTNLALVPDVDILAYGIRAKELRDLAWARGDLAQFDGTNMVRVPIGTNGQVPIVTGGIWVAGNQTATGSSSTTNLSQLNDTLISAPSANQALIYNGTKWANTTPASNPLLVSWIGSYGVGARTNMDVATNNVLAAFSVPPTASPASLGRFLQGQCSVILTNTNAFSATYDFTVDINGTKVIDAPRSVSANQEMYSFNIRLMWESATTASVFAEAFAPTTVGSTATTGYGIFGATTHRTTYLVATNAAFVWANTNAVTVSVGMRNTGGGTTSGIGVQRQSASLYALVDNTAVQPASANLTNLSNGASVVMNSLPVTPTGTNLVLDFGFPVLTYSVATNINLIQSTNRPAASTNTVFTLLRLAGDTVDRTLSWNSNWKRLGTNITTIPSNKVVVVSAMVVGTAESGVTFGIAKEE